jgi:hypothetical protein
MWNEAAIYRNSFSGNKPTTQKRETLSTWKEVAMA